MGCGLIYRERGKGEASQPATHSGGKCAFKMLIADTGSFLVTIGAADMRVGLFNVCCCS